MGKPTENEHLTPKNRLHKTLRFQRKNEEITAFFSFFQPFGDGNRTLLAFFCHRNALNKC